MSYVVAAPALLASAAADLENLGVAIVAAHSAAAAPTTRIPAAGADEVSTAVTSLFTGHAPLSTIKTFFSPSSAHTGEASSRHRHVLLAG